MSHTPGPWQAKDTPHSSNQDWVVLDGGTNGHSKRVCAVYSSQPEADARLIAAAPDLLAFADFVIGILKTAEICGLHLDMDKKHLLEQAKAVTKKARGE